MQDCEIVQQFDGELPRRIRVYPCRKEIDGTVTLADGNVLFSVIRDWVENCDY